MGSWISSPAMPVSERVKNKIDDLIASEHVFVASKSYCPYCRRAKQVIQSHYTPDGIKVLELDEILDGPEIQQYLTEKTGQRTVPNVFIGGKHIGGCDNVLALESTGKLKSML